MSLSVFTHHPDMSVLDDIQTWYAAQCDGEWEEDFGLRISTLSNPGWAVDIDLAFTPLEHRVFETFESSTGGGLSPWLVCRVEAGQFRGCGDPSQLERILRIFLEWATTATA